MMAPMILRCRLLLLTFLLSSFLPAHADSSDTLTVVTTIRPLHSIASSLLYGIVNPRLLLDQNQSPHHFSLRPSQRRTLAHADIVFWIGDELEAFMPRVIKALPKNVKTISLINRPGLTIHKLRPFQDITEHNDQHKHSSGGNDPHIWLSVDNAIVIARNMTATLSQQIPEKRQILNTNLNKLVTKLSGLKQQLNTMFSSRDFNYLVYHDAYQYFEKAMHVSPLAAVTNDEDQAPGIKHLTEINKLLTENTVNCIIINTQQLPPVINNLAGSDRLKKILLEPLGMQLNPGPGLYFELMQKIAGGYQQCSQN